MHEQHELPTPAIGSMICSITPNIREGLLEVFYGVYEKDPNKVLQAMVQMGVLVPTRDMTTVRTTQYFLDRYATELLRFSEAGVEVLVKDAKKTQEISCILRVSSTWQKQGDLKLCARALESERSSCFHSENNWIWSRCRHFGKPRYHSAPQFNPGNPTTVMACTRANCQQAARRNLLAQKVLGSRLEGHMEAIG